ncbi:uncharacterized protein LOC135223113 [Macrobrachium nipponense]|uniref:uncharacterized protein LOC135223113 n=1 Tax=Macrobrachium nipponense TaxID=159736 RepID=UPI0030C7A870
MTDASAAAFASAFLSSWVSRFGIPNDTTSATKTTFTLQLWKSFNHLLITQLHHTTAYHPESNDMIERFNCTLSRYSSSTWYLQHSWVLHSLWTTPKEGLNLSATEMVYGNLLVMTGEFFPDNKTSPDIIRRWTIVRKFTPCCPSYKPNEKALIPKDLHKAAQIFIRNDAVRPPLTQPYMGLYQVINHKQKALLINIRGTIDWVAIDCMQPTYLSNHITPPLQFSRMGRTLKAFQVIDRLRSRTRVPQPPAACRKDGRAGLLQELNKEDSKGHKNFLRIYPELFEEMVERLTPLLKKKDTKM